MAEHDDDDEKKNKIETNCWNGAHKTFIFIFSFVCVSVCWHQKTIFRWKIVSVIIHLSSLLVVFECRHTAQSVVHHFRQWSACGAHYHATIVPKIVATTAWARHVIFGTVTWILNERRHSGCHTHGRWRLNIDELGSNNLIWYLLFTVMFSFVMRVQTQTGEKLQFQRIIWVRNSASQRNFCENTINE